MNRIALLLIGVLPLLAPGQSVVGPAEEKIFYVDSEHIPCAPGGPLRCFRVGDRPDGPWTAHYEGLYAFTFVPGYRYRLKVKKERLDYGGQVADAPGTRWTVLEVLEKTPVREAGGLEALAGHTWTLIALEGVLPPVAPLPAGRSSTLVVQPDGKLSGQAGCNRFFGTVKLDDRQAFAAGPLGTTRKMCDPPTMKVEAAVLAGLGRATRYAVTTNELRLTDADGTHALVFHREEGAAAEVK